jgi:periplasmic protein TonB
MARTTIMTVSTRDFASRGAVLAVSALAHVLVYGALSLAPASTSWPRTSLIVTELIVTESPTPPVHIREPVTPRRPLARPKPQMKPEPEARPVETVAPASTPRVETQLELPSAREIATPSAREIATAPTETTSPTMSSETTREVSDTPTGSSPVAPSTRALGPSTTAHLSSGSAAVVAALPPGAALASAVTRTAIPRGGYQVTPAYPASARRLGVEGTALLRVFVDAKGHVGEVVVKQSAGHPDLDRAATDAVRRWRFDPARQGADAIAMWVELPVEFHLR